MTWVMRRGQIKHLLYEHCLNGRIDKDLLKEQFDALNSVEPTKHGRWKTLKSGNDAVCTNCEKYWIPVEDKYDFRYCPNCGARMDLTK